MLVGCSVAGGPGGPAEHERVSRYHHFTIYFQHKSPQSTGRHCPAPQRGPSSETLSWEDEAQVGFSALQESENPSKAWP